MNEILWQRKIKKTEQSIQEESNEFSHISDSSIAPVML
jgi:hypothetical protein